MSALGVGGPGERRWRERLELKEVLVAGGVWQLVPGGADRVGARVGGPGERRWPESLEPTGGARRHKGMGRRRNRSLAVGQALIGLVVTGLVLAGCSGGGDDATTAVSDSAAGGSGGDGGEATVDAGGSVVPVASSAQLVSGGRSIIRTAELEVEVDGVQDASREAVAVAERAGGFLAHEETTLGDDPSAVLVLKVAPERFTAALDELASLGEVVAKQVGSDDVTEVVVDLEGRLAAATASVVRLRELLGAAGDVAQIVAVEAELARREGELESLAGQLRTLESQIDLATITLRLTPGTASPSVSEDIPGFLAGLRTGWVAFVNVAGGAATVVGFALPFAAVASVVAVPVVWWHRRRAAPAV